MDSDGLTKVFTIPWRDRPSSQDGRHLFRGAPGVDRRETRLAATTASSSRSSAVATGVLA